MKKTTPNRPDRKPAKSGGFRSHADKDAAPKSDGGRPGERIAKVLARAGVASRRDAETMVEEGRVTVNGRKVLSPALNVMPKDRITVDGQEVGEPQPPRLWLYHKPTGLVTTEKDEKGRDTVFGNLPEELPRVMSVGRLDLNSEGLLLLTNDGEIKRRLELPDTGWLRKYRVRVKGAPMETTLEPLRKGIEIDGEKFQPMEVAFDRQQGANAWLTVGIREGRNREIRRAMEAIGLTVNRLIRISYGPFRLGELKPGAVEEVRGRVLRDQLGLEDAGDDGFAKPRRDVSRGGKPGGPRKETLGRKPGGDFKPRGDRDGKGFGGKPRGDRDDRGFGDKPRRDRDGKGFGDKPRGDRDGKGFGDKPRGDRDGKGFGGKPRGDRDGKGFGGKPRGDRDGKGFGDKPRGDRDGKGFGGKPRGDRDDRGKAFEGKRPQKSGGKGPGEKSGGFKSQGYKSHGGGKDGKPRSSGYKSHSDRPKKRD